MKNLVITIARSYGSGGKIIGKALAEKLNIQFVDRELLQIASIESGINETLFNAADEDTKQKSAPIFKRPAYQGELIPPEEDGFTSNENLFNYQAAVLKEMAKTESFVVMGRAANFVLADTPNVVSINIQAPYDFLVQTAMDKMRISKKDAERFVKKINRYRSEYHAYYTGTSWTDPVQYDLTLNSAKVGIDNCVTLILDYLRMQGKIEG